jgi:hypothetical protein
MREIGQISLIQVQRSSLKVERGTESYYDPTPLIVVEHLLLLPQGVIGVTTDGSQIMDIHHEYHPNSHNHKGVNGVSIGFTNHYRSMRSKLGEHLVDGIAGENILVESSTSHSLADLGERLAIQIQPTGRYIYLSDLKVATPCVEFSLFTANHGMPLPAAQLKETLRFLDSGTRGFYARVEGRQDNVTLRVGDKVFTGMKSN